MVQRKAERSADGAAADRAPIPTHGGAALEASHQRRLEGALGADLSGMRVHTFPDRASALRLITAVALLVTSIWSDRVYLDMSLIADLHAAAA
jgi:hypothetical protein